MRAYAGECGSPVAFVLAMNGERRHLSSSQRAAIAAEALPLFRAEAKARQQQAGRAYGRGHPSPEPDTKLRHFCDEAIPPPVEPDPSAVETQQERDDRAENAQTAVAQAARAAGTNRRAVDDAAQVLNLDPDLFEQVKAGKLSAGRARKQATKAERERRLGEEQAAEERILDKRDHDGELARQRLHVAYCRTVVEMLELPQYDPVMLAPLLDPLEWRSAEELRGRIEAWYARLFAQRFTGPRPLHAGAGEEEPFPSEEAREGSDQ